MNRYSHLHDLSGCWLGWELGRRGSSSGIMKSTIKLMICGSRLQNGWWNGRCIKLKLKIDLSFRWLRVLAYKLKHQAPSDDRTIRYTMWTVVTAKDLVEGSLTRNSKFPEHTAFHGRKDNVPFSWLSLPPSYQRSAWP